MAFERIQMVAGDSTDNIFGILGRGEAWAKKQLPVTGLPSYAENRDAFSTPENGTLRSGIGSSRRRE